MRTQDSQLATGPTGRWYFVITIASVGLLAAVPFFHAASRLDRPQLRRVGAGMAAGGLLGFVLMSVSPSDDTGTATGWLSDLAVLILLTVLLVATLLLIGLRREVYRATVGAEPPTDNQSAMANVEEARRKRAEARKLAAKDPMMARDLGVGRPGSTQGYDDGGLLELNFATAQQLSAVWPSAHPCGERRGNAGSFGAFRERGGRGHVWPDRRGAHTHGPRPGNHRRRPMTPSMCLLTGEAVVVSVKVGAIARVPAVDGCGPRRRGQRHSSRSRRGLWSVTPARLTSIR